MTFTAADMPAEMLVSWTLIGVADAFPADQRTPEGVAIVTARGLSAVLSITAQGPIVDAVRHHHRAVLAFMRRSSFLPAPWGRRFDSLMEAEGFLAGVAPRARERLATLARALEWGVRIRVPIGPAAAADADSPGRAYLAARRAERAGIEATERVARELSLALASGYVGAVADHHVTMRGPGLVTAAVLSIDRSIAKDDLASALRRMLGDIRPTVSGPWPAYSFSGLSASAEDCP